MGYRAVYYKNLAKGVEVGALDGGEKEMKRLLRTYDGLDKDCHCDKCGPALAEGEVQKPKPPGIKGRGEMLMHLRCYDAELKALATMTETTLPDLSSECGTAEEIAAHCTKVGLEEEALASVYELLKVGTPTVGKKFVAPDGATYQVKAAKGFDQKDTKQPTKTKIMIQSELHPILEVDETSGVEEAEEDSELLKNGLTKQGETAIAQMVDHIVKNHTLADVQQNIMEDRIERETKKHKKASRNLLRMMGHAKIEEKRNSVLGDRLTLAGAAKQWGIENGIEEAQLDELIGDPEVFGDDRALEESADEWSTDNDDSESEVEPPVEKEQPRPEKKKIEVALPVDVEAET